MKKLNKQFQARVGNWKINFKKEYSKSTKTWNPNRKALQSFPRHLVNKASLKYEVVQRFIFRIPGKSLRNKPAHCSFLTGRYHSLTSKPSEKTHLSLISIVVVSRSKQITTVAMEPKLKPSTSCHSKPLPSCLEGSRYSSSI